MAWLVSIVWPVWARSALENAARTRSQKAADPRRELSMPSAELFGAIAVPSLIASVAGFHVRAVGSIGDCSPAASALAKGSSPKGPMRELLLAARRLTTRWLGVHVPRTFNLGADRLSHPSMLSSVALEAAAAGFEPHVITNVTAPELALGPGAFSVGPDHPVWSDLRLAIDASHP